MMKTLLKIFISAVLMAAAPLAGTAQVDAPLYQNVISDDVNAQIDTSSHGYKPKKAELKATDNDTQIQAGDDIGELLRRLNRLYDAGKYDEAISLSKSIHENFKSLNVNDESRRQMFTIASFKDMEYNEKADSATKRFIRRNPFYEPQSSDPVSFKECHGNYNTIPRFSIWVAFGQSIAIPHLDTVHVITDTASIKPNYDTDNSETMQIGFEYHPWEFLSIAVAPTYSKYQYSRSTERSKLATFHYDESSKIFSVPLRIEGYLVTGKKKWVPSLYAGASVKYIFKSTYNAYTQTVGDPKYRIDNKEHNLDDKTKINYAILCGARLSFNYRRITIFGDAGLSLDQKPFNNPDAAYSNSYLAYDKMYIPDIFHIIELSATIGIKVNLMYKTIAKYGYGH